MGDYIDSNTQAEGGAAAIYGKDQPMTDRHGSPPPNYGASPPSQYGPPTQNPYGAPPPNYGAPPPNPYGAPPPNYSPPPQNPYAAYQPYMRPVMAGENMITASGIAMIASSFYGLAVSIALAIAYSSLWDYYGYYGGYGYGYYRGPSAAPAYLAIFASVLALVSGIICAVSASKRNMAKVIMGFGIAILSLGVITAILFLTSFDRNETELYIANIVALVFIVPHSIILPIFYIVGGNIRKNAPM